MPTLQELHEQLKGIRKEKKIITDTFKDALKSSKEYQDTMEKMKDLRIKKSQIENEVKLSFDSEFSKLEKMSKEESDLKEMMGDITLTMYAKGQDVTFLDEYQNTFEPEFKISFKKAIKKAD